MTQSDLDPSLESDLEDILSEHDGEPPRASALVVAPGLQQEPEGRRFFSWGEFKASTVPVCEEL